MEKVENAENNENVDTVENCATPARGAQLDPETLGHPAAVVQRNCSTPVRPDQRDRPPLPTTCCKDKLSEDRPISLQHVAETGPTPSSGERSTRKGNPPRRMDKDY